VKRVFVLCLDYFKLLTVFVCPDDVSEVVGEDSFADNDVEMWTKTN